MKSQKGILRSCTTISDKIRGPTGVNGKNPPFPLQCYTIKICVSFHVIMSIVLQQIYPTLKWGGGLIHKIAQLITMTGLWA